MRAENINRMETTKMKMQQMCGKTVKDKISNKSILEISKLEVSGKLYT